MFDRSIEGHFMWQPSEQQAKATEYSIRARRPPGQGLKALQTEFSLPVASRALTNQDSI
jgi:hypothetical protein